MASARPPHGLTRVFARVAARLAAWRAGQRDLPALLLRLPLALGIGWLAWEAARGALRVDLPHLLGAGLTAAAWLLTRRQWSAAALVAALLLPAAWQLAVAVPAARQALAAHPGYVRVEGTVRQRRTVKAAPVPTVALLLGDATLWAGPETRRLAEVEVWLPAHSEWAFPHRSRQRIGGMPAADHPVTVTGQGRLRLRLAEAQHYRPAEPLHAWSGEALRLHLRDRAAYYLSPAALGTYLPVVLGLRERDTPEARAVSAAFRRVGVAHLFAISGLHVGLLFLLVGGLLRALLSGLQPAQGWAHAPGARRAAVLAALWAYVALIGFPLPAVRATLMGSVLLWHEQWGTRSPPLYLLGLAAGVLLAFDVSQLYDVSFQLSFGAYFFLLCALGLYRPLDAERSDAARSALGRWARKGLEAVRINLWMTLVITAGLWPLVAATFGRLPLAVFVGNLVMIPLLAFAVLPLGLAGLAVSLAHAWLPPGGWSERGVFTALDAALRGWVWVVERLDAVSRPLVVSLRPDADPRFYVAYYAVLLAGIGWAWRRRRRVAGRHGTVP